MLTRYFALAFGIVYVIVGIVGLIPAFYTTPPASAPHVDATAAYGYLFGIFPVNAWHDAVHILTGLAGIACSARLRASVYYSRILFLAFGLLTVLGFMPQANTLWGLVPIFGSDTWLHAVTSIAGAFFGWVAPPVEEDELVPAHA